MKNAVLFSFVTLSLIGCGSDTSERTTSPVTAHSKSPKPLFEAHLLRTPFGSAEKAWLGALRLAALESDAPVHSSHARTIQVPCAVSQIEQDSCERRSAAIAQSKATTKSPTGKRIPRAFLWSSRELAIRKKEANSRGQRVTCCGMADSTMRGRSADVTPRPTNGTGLASTYDAKPLCSPWPGDFEWAVRHQLRETPTRTLLST
jgi:hypothetical protein